MSMIAAKHAHRAVTISKSLGARVAIRFLRKRDVEWNEVVMILAGKV